MPSVVLLASLFFVSCEDPGKIGLNINPEGGVVLSKYQEFTLSSTQVQFDPRSTLNSFSFQAGMFTDPDFGITTSKSYTWLGVQPTVPLLSETAAYASMTMSIQFSSIYGSEAENDEFQSFQVYQLAEEIVPGTDYTRVDEIALGSLMRNFDLIIQVEDTLRTDSLFTFSLSDAVGQSIFDKLELNDGTFESDTAFNEFFKGIAIIADAGNNKITQFNPASFGISLNYNETNADGEIVDRVYSFDLGAMKFFNLTSDLSGTALAGILPDNNEFSPSGDFRYVQSGTMISLKVDYNPVFDFLDTIENLVIQKAFLTVGDVPVNQPGADFPFSLIGYFTDDVNTWPVVTGTIIDQNEFFVTLQEELVPPSFYSNPQNIVLGILDTLTFEATMSTHIQYLHGGKYDITDDPLEHKGKILLFTPTSVETPQSSPSHTLAKYFKVHKDSIKLKIHYSVPN